MDLESVDRALNKFAWGFHGAVRFQWGFITVWIGFSIRFPCGCTWVRSGLSNSRTRLPGPIFGPILASLLPGVGPTPGSRRPGLRRGRREPGFFPPRRQGGQNRSKNGPREPCTIVTEAAADQRVLLCPGALARRLTRAFAVALQGGRCGRPTDLPPVHRGWGAPF